MSSRSSKSEHQFRNPWSIEAHRVHMTHRTNAADRFSDADRRPTPTMCFVNDGHRADLDPENPVHLFAAMVCTRVQCRSRGLIDRDIVQLTTIGNSLGISAFHTKAIMNLIDGAQPPVVLNNQILEMLDPILATSEQKKTRVPARVWIGLSVWMISIIIAFAMI